MLPEAIPLPPPPMLGAEPPPPPGPVPPGPTPPGAAPTPGKQTAVQLSFRATREQLFAAWQGLANLADAAGTVHVTVEGRKEDGFDQVWLRNAVTEPIEESGAEVDG
jgi:hypothetical protein